MNLVQPFETLDEIILNQFQKVTEQAHTLGRALACQRPAF